MELIILRRRRTVATLLLWLARCAGASSSPLAAHDIPPSVTVLAFVHPEEDRLRVLVRVPLEAMRDVELPLKGLGYLDLERAWPALREAAVLWIVDYLEVYEGKRRLPEPRLAAVQVSLPSDRSFSAYESALAHVTGPPPPPTTELYWQQAMLDVLLEYPIVSQRSRFSVKPMLGHLGQRTTTTLHFLGPDGRERTFRYQGDPGMVHLDPRWHQAGWSFLRFGLQQLLDGADYLVFLVCLAMPFRRFWTLVPIVTAFSAGHSITLLASAAGWAPDSLWFPPLVETLIAASIVLVALENILGPKLYRRWILALAFGLIYGFGFSFALWQKLQFAGSHPVTAALAFNLGLELGQLVVLALTIPLFAALFRSVIPERIGVILFSAILAHTGWHWMTARGTRLGQYQFTWPALDLGFLAAAMRWAVLVPIIAAAAWLLHSLFQKLRYRMETGVEPGGGLFQLHRTAKQ